jgi:mannose-6-phosphate isomerase-like protein (cupin superfamily)
MSNTALEGMEVHPLVAILEQQDEAPVEFRGFLGTGDSHTLHLYPDLTISAWVEIPVNSVVHWERDLTDSRRVRVFVGPKAEIAEITRQRLPARQSQMSLSRWAGISVDTSRPRLPPYRVNPPQAVRSAASTATEGNMSVIVHRKSVLHIDGSPSSTGRAPSPSVLQRALAQLRPETPWPVVWVTPAGPPYLAHCHPVDEQFLLLAGYLEFWDVEAGPEAYFPVHPGDELIIPAGRVHCVRRRQEATYVMRLSAPVDMDISSSNTFSPWRMIRSR